MIISIASGKGGTGKTTVAVNLALVAGQAQYLDCDVEEPNGHLYIAPELTRQADVTVPVPVVDEKKCTNCGRCAEICAFRAIAVLPSTVMIFNEMCHGCGACEYLCPQQAIAYSQRKIGHIAVGSRNNLDYIQGLLNIGEPMAPPVINAVKSHIDTNRLTILDAPPGTSCPMVSAVRNTDYCVLVTEPTPFGLNDLKLAVAVIRKLNLYFGVVVNKADASTAIIEEYCEQENIPILSNIPFSKEVAQLSSKAIPIVTELPEYRLIFSKLLTTIHEKVYEANHHHKR